MSFIAHKKQITQIRNVGEELLSIYFHFSDYLQKKVDNLTLAVQESNFFRSVFLYFERW